MGTHLKQKQLYEKQDEFKRLLKSVGMSQRTFAQNYFEDTQGDFQDNEECERFFQVFKKEISRPTTAIEKIERYLEFLYTTDEFLNGGNIRPVCLSKDLLPAGFVKELAKASKRLTKRLEAEQLGYIDEEEDI